MTRNPVEDAKHILDTYWADSGGDYRFPIDPVAIARSMGASVLVADLPSRVSGQVSMDDWGSTIFLSRDNGPQRQRFTCAHEIGHIFDRTRPGASRKNFVDYRDDRAASGTDIDEIYANRFAAELLMPSSEVASLAQRNWSTEAMARRFGVSVQAMAIRRDNLKLN